MIPEGKPGERRYGRSHINKIGYPEHPEHCVESIDQHWIAQRQCHRKRGHGPNGEFCKQHAKRYEDKT